MNATLAAMPYTGGSVPARGGFILCGSNRPNLTNYKLLYQDTIYLEIQGGNPPYDLSLTRTRDASDFCGTFFDNRTSTERPTDDGRLQGKIVLRGNSYNYTPSDWAMYGQGVKEMKVGDSLQFFAVEHANNTGPGGGFRSFSSTNYTLVANQSEVGQWTPPRVGAAELGTKAKSFATVALLGLLVSVVVVV